MRFATATKIIGGALTLEPAPKTTVQRLSDLDDRLRKLEAAKSVQKTKPLFKFGLIADIQHADIDDATNFSGSEFRGYRRALEVAKTAVDYWNTDERARGISFVAQLGDLIDGQNAGKYGQGLKFEQPQSKVAANRVLEALDGLNNGLTPYLHAIGNHEIYNFSEQEMADLLGIEVREGSSETPSPLYYSLSPYPGWRIVMLNGYEQSTALPEGSKGRLEAEAILHQHHPNAAAVIDGQGGVDYFAGVSGMDQRFVPFNGGFGPEQLQWFSETIREARWRGERVICLTHMPLHPMACCRSRHDSPAVARNLPYDCPEALRICWEEGRGCVVAVFAGHAHSGGHYTEPNEANHTQPMHPMPGEPAPKPDDSAPAPPGPPTRPGLHHITVEAVLTHAHAYGHVEVHADRLELVGVAPSSMGEAEARKEGYIPSRSLPLAPFTPVSDL